MGFVEGEEMFLLCIGWYSRRKEEVAEGAAKEDQGMVSWSEEGRDLGRRGQGRGKE